MTYKRKAKLLIFFFAYFNEKSIGRVLTQIPQSLNDEFDAEILIVNDTSECKILETAIVENRANIPFKLTVLNNAINQGYGGNQKIGFSYAIKYDFDFIVLMYGNGDHDPELLGELIAPFRSREVDAVFGSQIILSDNYPDILINFYTIAGNYLLSKIQGLLLGINLTEFCSSYRIFSLASIKKLPFERNANDSSFNTEIIAQLVMAGCKIADVPIKKNNSKNVGLLNYLNYFVKSLKTSFQAKLQIINIFYDRRFDISNQEDNGYLPKLDFDSSHSRVISLIPRFSTILDVGSGFGAVGVELKKRNNCIVFGCDYAPGYMTKFYDGFETRDLDNGLPLFRGQKFDYILALDVIEHLKCPEDFLDQLRDIAATSGAKVILTTGNVAFLLMRLSLLIGRFEYGKRGILDLTHKRLYTLRSLERALSAAGFEVERREGVGVPFPLVFGRGALSNILMSLNRQLVKVWPSMFGFQLLVIAAPRPNIEILLNHARVVISK